ncbi:unnamed protein product [Strongylus vulgaris]|uniref:Uncharacterized protein n=1 Tax=Strongylus vulgaris TaxID=40348 RepID=A0A3P7JFK2_STRVU|nr:unnamed protein product [Strongylus vulgaris]
MAASDAKEFWLAVSADASDEGMAAFVYPLNDQSAHLIMAKSRLPSIKARNCTKNGIERNHDSSLLAVFKAVKADTSPRKIHILSD